MRQRSLASSRPVPFLHVQRQPSQPQSCAFLPCPCLPSPLSPRYVPEVCLPSLLLPFTWPAVRGATAEGHTSTDPARWNGGSQPSGLVIPSGRYTGVHCQHTSLLRVSTCWPALRSRPCTGHSWLR